MEEEIRKKVFDDITGKVYDLSPRQECSRALETISKAKPGNVQEIAASQIRILSSFYRLALEQAQRSFRLGLVAATVGLVFFVAAIAFLLIKNNQSVATAGILSGALIEVISGLNFYLYGSTSKQLGDFFTKLDSLQCILLANTFCESLKSPHKEESRTELIRKLAGIEITVPETQERDGQKVQK
jgi:hypothetical protein